jgi:coenzyme PQQ biosynthesis protein PqqD
MTRGDAVLRRAPDVRFRHVDEETVVIRQATAEALVLNEVAGRILELVDGSRDLAAVIAALEAEYDVSSQELGDDVNEYVDELLASGLVIEVAG